MPPGSAGRRVLPTLDTGSGLCSALTCRLGSDRADGAVLVRGGIEQVEQPHQGCVLGSLARERAAGGLVLRHHDVLPRGILRVTGCSTWSGDELASVSQVDADRR